MTSEKAQSISGTWTETDLTGAGCSHRRLVWDNLGEVCQIKMWRVSNSRQGNLNLKTDIQSKLLRKEYHKGSRVWRRIIWQWCTEWTEGKGDRPELKRLIRRQSRLIAKKSWKGEGQSIRKIMKKESWSASE